MTSENLTLETNGGRHPYEASGTRLGRSFASQQDKRVYLEFYGLHEAPFSITPDPQFLFLSTTHQVAIDKVLYGITSRMGFILLTGEVGTGKTTVCRSILDHLNGNAETVYIINPSLSGKEIISCILDDLGIIYPSLTSKKDLIIRLNNFLLSGNTKNAVVIIDDAQTMSLEALEDLRLLSNLETDKDKLLQIVLVGQPELLEIISCNELRQLQQRVAINCMLDYLKEEEVGGYITQRLYVAGDRGRVRFTRRAVRMVYKHSNGIPRLINKICDFALTAGYVSNDFIIRPEHVQKAVIELQDLKVNNKKNHRKKAEPKSRLIMLSCVLLLGLVSAVLFFNNDNIGVFGKITKENIVLPATAITPLRNVGVDEKVSANSIPDKTIRVAEKASSSLIPVKTDTVSDNEAGNAVPAKTQQVEKKSEKKLEQTTIQPEPETTASNRGVVKAAPKSDPYLYALQLGSYRTLQGVRNAYKKYKNQGINVHWQRHDQGTKGVWYRLVTTRFTSKSAAEQYKRDHGLNNCIVTYAPWTILIGRYPSWKSYDQIQKRMRKNHFDCYYMKTEDGHYKAYTGLFPSYEKARQISSRLARLGITSKVVKE